MAVHMSFDFSDSDCCHTPVIVRIEKDLTFGQMSSIDESVQKKIDEYVENEEYWDSDECLLDEVIKQFAKSLEFEYSFISIDYESVC
jgi:dTDP-D-glucose 4,6-dehydratase